jgi:zinc protease
MMNPKLKSHRNAFPGPEDITKEILPNGITILVRSNFNSPTLSMRGYLLSGSIHDPDDKLGLSYMTSHGLMNSTQFNDFQSLYNKIESAGARLSFSSGTLITSFNAHALSEDLQLMLNIAAESLRYPIFPQKEFSRQKNQMLTALAIRSQDTASMAALTFDQILYAGHPYARPEEGFVETIAALTREDEVNFYQNTYGPQGMVIAIVGAAEAKTAVDAVKAAFGDWQNDRQRSLPELPVLAKLDSTIQKRVHIPGKFQADIVMGCAAPERLSEDYFPLRVGNNILGEFGMMGRIGERVREKAGLAYYAYSSLNASLGPGAWEMIAGVNPDNIERTIDLIREEISRFVAEPVSEKELADTKSNYRGRMPLILESNGGVAASLLNIERYNLGLDYLQNYPDLVDAVTAEQILEASRKYLDPEKLAVAIAQP